MTNEQNHGGPCVNTDRELWRLVPDSYYSPSIHVTAGNGIGINVGGHVIVMPIERWHALAKASLAHEPKAEPEYRQIGLKKAQGRSEFVWWEIPREGVPVYIRVSENRGDES